MQQQLRTKYKKQQQRIKISKNIATKHHKDTPHYFIPVSRKTATHVKQPHSKYNVKTNIFNVNIC